MNEKLIRWLEEDPSRECRIRFDRACKSLSVSITDGQRAGQLMISMDLATSANVDIVSMDIEKLLSQWIE